MTFYSFIIIVVFIITLIVFTLILLFLYWCALVSFLILTFFKSLFRSHVKHFELQFNLCQRCCINKVCLIIDFYDLSLLLGWCWFRRFILAAGWSRAARMWSSLTLVPLPGTWTAGRETCGRPATLACPIMTGRPTTRLSWARWSPGSSKRSAAVQSAAQYAA